MIKCLNHLLTLFRGGERVGSLLLGLPIPNLTIPQWHLITVSLLRTWGPTTRPWPVLTAWCYDSGHVFIWSEWWHSIRAMELMWWLNHCFNWGEEGRFTPIHWGPTAKSTTHCIVETRHI